MLFLATLAPLAGAQPTASIERLDTRHLDLGWQIDLAPMLMARYRHASELPAAVCLLSSLWLLFWLLQARLSIPPCPAHPATSPSAELLSVRVNRFVTAVIST